MNYLKYIINTLDIIFLIINIIIFILVSNYFFNIHLQGFEIIYYKDSLNSSVIIYSISNFIINIFWLFIKLILHFTLKKNKFNVNICFSTINLIISFFFFYMAIYLLNSLADVKLFK
jgi:hypothetical protein